ncbi:MAG: hypothetical protein NTU49_02320 [Gammaproteobacteria bacterium]|nr:hypothetical protein [Gammaproteobacteria bacterium]
MSRNNEKAERYNQGDLPTCAITHQAFFSQVQLNCGHNFEDKAIKDWFRRNGTCPCCRADISAFNPVVDDRLVQTLLTHPEFYKEVYFNLDHFFETVKENKLSTKNAQRIITLLLNAKNHLNEKSDGKSAIEVLASTEEGRDVLRHYANVKIIDEEAHYYFGSALIEKENLEIMLDGFSIQAWILMNDESYFLTEEILSIEAIKNEEKKAFEKTLSRHVFFCPKMRDKSDLPYSHLTNTLLQKIVYGDEKSLKSMLSSFKRDRAALRLLLTSLGAVVDYSGRDISNFTLLQAAAAVGDKKMCEIIMPYFYFIQNGSEEITAQVMEIFTDGMEVYFERQKNISATVFLLNNIKLAINEATESDLDSGLLKQNNSSILCNQALPEFREDCKKLFSNDLAFNPQHLLLALETYEKKADQWSGSNAVKQKKQTLFWRQIIGYFQRFLPANYAQVFAQGLYNVVESRNSLLRSFIFGDQPECSFFPLADDNSGLGFDFAVSWDGPVSSSPKIDDQNSYLFRALVLEKNKELAVSLLSDESRSLLRCSMM